MTTDRATGALTAALPMADPAALEKLLPGAPDKGQAVKLANPLSSELSVLRPLLMPGLLQALIHNLNNGQPDVRLFELGLAFTPTNDGSKPRERLLLAAVATGAGQRAWWGQKTNPYDFYDIRGAAEALFEAGCDDGSPGSSQGVVSIDFHREAESLEAAIRSAIADVQKAGCAVAQVTLEADVLASLKESR